MLGVSRPIYVAVDSPNLGFPYFNFLGGYQLKKNTLYIHKPKQLWKLSKLITNGTDKGKTNNFQKIMG